MATRFRFPSSGAATVSPATQSYSHASTTRRQLLLATGTTLTTEAVTPDAADHLVAGDALHVQFISDPLKAQTFTSGDVFKFALQCLESNNSNNLNVQIWMGIVNEAGSSAVGTIRSKTTHATEIATALTNRFLSSTLSNTVSCSDGDRLVVEISVTGTPAAAGGTQGHNASIRWGGDGAGGDLGENNTDTGTTLNPWLEFANDIQFLGPTAPPEGVDYQPLAKRTLSTAIMAGALAFTPMLASAPPADAAARGEGTSTLRYTQLQYQSITAPVVVPPVDTNSVDKWKPTYVDRIPGRVNIPVGFTVAPFPQPAPPTPADADAPSNSGVISAAKVVQYQSVVGPVVVPSASTLTTNWQPEYPDIIRRRDSRHPSVTSGYVGRLQTSVAELVASTSATASVSASLSTSIPLVATPSLTATASSNLSTAITLATTPSLTATVSGALSTGIELATSPSLTATAAAALNTSITLVSAPSLTASVEASLYITGVVSQSQASIIMPEKRIQYVSLVGPVRVPPAAPAVITGWDATYPDMVPRRRVTAPQPGQQMFGVEIEVPVESWTGNTLYPQFILDRRNPTSRRQQSTVVAYLPSDTPPAAPTFFDAVFPDTISRRRTNAHQIPGQQMFGVEVDVPVESWTGNTLYPTFITDRNRVGIHASRRQFFTIRVAPAITNLGEVVFTGTATATASLTTAIPVASAVSLTGTVNPTTLNTQISLASGISGTAAVNAALSTQITSAATASATATLNAALATQIQMAASPVGTATVGATLLVPGALTSQSEMTATVNAVLSTQIVAGASATATGTLNATLTTQVTPAATVPTAAAVNCALTTQITLNSTASGNCTVAAQLSAGSSLEAACLGSTACSVDLTTAKPIASACGGTATVSVAITTRIAPASLATASASATASLTTEILVTGNATVRATVTADLITPITEFYSAPKHRTFAAQGQTRTIKAAGNSRKFTV